MHEHFDADGNPCRAADAFRTVVTREPEWDESSAARALELERHESNVCPCGCGQPLEEAGDKDRAFRVQKFTCHARRAIEQLRQKEADQAEREKRPEGWDVGLTYFVDDSFVPDPQGGVKRGN